MKAPVLTGFVVMAAIAAIIFSNKAKAMQDATAAGYILNPNDSVDSQYINGGTAMPADNSPPTTMSDAGLIALQGREGFSPTPYPDHKGYSIGYGHLILPTESFTVIDHAMGMQLLQNDVGWAEIAVSNAVTAPITQNAFDALVSFCFNVGITAFQNSTLLKKVNAMDVTAVDEFGKWIYSRDASGNKVVDAGLRDSRRPSEAAQFTA